MVTNSHFWVSVGVCKVDYIVGANPKKMSYLVGFGLNYPQKVHHRAVSIVSIKEDLAHVTCKEGFTDWCNCWGS